MPRSTAVGAGAIMTPPPSPPVSESSSGPQTESLCKPVRVGNFYADTLHPDWARANARVIQRGWQQFQQHVSSTTQSGFHPEDRSTHPGYRALEYRPGNVDRYPKREKRLGQVFYCSPCGLPPLRYPVWVEGTESADLSGRFKRAVVWDERVMALEPVSTPFTPGRCDPRLDRLRGIRSLVFTTVIHPKLAITRNAGTDLYRYASYGGHLPMKAFHSLLVDLHRLHTLPGCGGAFLRDIKAENVAVPLKLHADLPTGPLPPLRIFDFEDDVVFGDELAGFTRADARGTAACLTEELVQGMYETGTNEGAATADVKDVTRQRTAFARAADNYACLLMVLLLTAEPGSPLQLVATCDERIDAVGPLPLGLMHAGNRNLFKPWIEAHVRSAYVDDIYALLTDPAAFAQTHPDHAPLARMFKLEASA